MVRVEVLQHFLEVELVDPKTADRAEAVVLVTLLERGDGVSRWRWLCRPARHGLAVLQGGCDALWIVPIAPLRL
jgi:hypothetical protein